MDSSLQIKSGWYFGYFFRFSFYLVLIYGVCVCVQCVWMWAILNFAFMLIQSDLPNVHSVIEMVIFLLYFTVAHQKNVSRSVTNFYGNTWKRWTLLSCLLQRQNMLWNDTKWSIENRCTFNESKIAQKNKIERKK